MILALQKRVYESEARLYDDWNLPPLTQTIDSLRAEFATSLVLKAVDGDATIVFPAVPRFELFTGNLSAANIRLYERLGYRHYREQVMSPTVTLVFMEKKR